MTVRTGWIDSVKGITIIMVVAHHALLGLDAANMASKSAIFWDDLFAAVRMPLFFMVAGLFARKAIDGPWLKFLDGKLVHFGYFYLLWSLILFSVRFGGNSVAHHQTSFFEVFRIAWDPISTIWFMYALALAFGFARLARKLHPTVVIGITAIIQTAALALPQIPTLVIINKFDYLVLFFVVGVYLSADIRNQAAHATTKSTAMSALLFCLIALPAHFAGLLVAPLIYPAAAFAGIGTVVSIVSLFSGSAVCRGFAFIGRYSLPIYLTHFLPVAAIRVVLLRVGINEPLFVYLACVAGSVAAGILADRVTSGTPLRFLFNRPRWAHLKGLSAPVHAEV